MNSSAYAIQIIPDVTIDDKYAAVIAETQSRINSFTENALKGDRVRELFQLERSRVDPKGAARLLRAQGRLAAGFQFETRSDVGDDNFRVYVKKHFDNGKSFKFYLTPPVQAIMLQLISLEDRRTIAIFSMLNSSLDVGYRILTTLYGNQLKRLVTKSEESLRITISTKLEKLSLAKSSDDEDLWKSADEADVRASVQPQEGRRSSQDNLLQVLADESTFAEITHYVESVVAKSDRIREKLLTLEKNPDIPRSEIYQMMIGEDLDQLENCYARIHIYVKAFYKNKDKRGLGQNRVLRQFFAGQIEKITGETALLEDLLSLTDDEYFKNIARHKELGR